MAYEFFFKAYKGVFLSDEHNIKPYKQPSPQNLVGPAEAVSPKGSPIPSLTTSFPSAPA